MSPAQLHLPRSPAGPAAEGSGNSGKPENAKADNSGELRIFHDTIPTYLVAWILLRMTGKDTRPVIGRNEDEVSMTVGKETDNRERDRIPHRAVIRYCAGERGECRLARLVNYSSTGMYLELDYPPPKLGANLLIEVLDREDAAQDPLVECQRPKTCYYAKVIWKKNLPHSSAEYGVGLRYLFTAGPEN